MKFIPNAVARKFAKQVLLTKKHSPTILFFAGTAGAVTSTVLACRATLRLESVLDEHNENLELIGKARVEKPNNYSEKDAQRDKAVLYTQTVVKFTKLYAPAIGLGVVSYGALYGSHRILTKRNAALSAAYATLDKAFKEYRKRVVDEYGEEKDRRFLFGEETYEEIVEDKNGPKKVKKVGPKAASMYAVCFDEFNPNWERDPRSNKIFLQGQQAYANQQLAAKGYLLLNDVYRSLRFPDTTAGAVVGWIYQGPDAGNGFVDFGIFTRDDWKAHDFVLGREGSVWLDFNVDGEIYQKLDEIG